VLCGSSLGALCGKLEHGCPGTDPQHALCPAHSLNNPPDPSPRLLHLLWCEESSPETPCPVGNSRLTGGLLKIAALLEEGGVCGIPTDTVYALAASCKNPQAIEKIYNIKDRPAEKPICICISSVEQLVEAKPPFSPLLWEFMRNVYPGGISCIVSKGDWLFKLGKLGIFTSDSIMIRVPDHTVTCHLCDITGPLAITSANPSGEADSTHHSMVINLDKLTDSYPHITYELTNLHCFHKICKESCYMTTLMKVDLTFKSLIHIQCHNAHLAGLLLQNEALFIIL
uniref:Threonylcarbamoyl-AMP synthase n=1 Tax=Seriola dumerili TaxID=41447 RepID=A0A3B4TT91_SERDU